jgi:hypothetical protein
MKRELAVLDDILAAVGRTPLVRLSRIGRGIRTPVYGKLENLNPGGSVKDRICLAMVEAAEESGALTPGGVIVEPTSGNTGIGLAFAAAIRGYRLLQGFRGYPAADLPALEDLLLRLSALVEAVPELQELDFNPILALPPGQGCVILDSRIRVADAPA